MQKIIQNAYLGKNLKRLRLAQGFSQNDVVTKIQLLGSKMSRSSYSMIEAGTRNIKETDLVALQKIYAVDFGEFFKDIKASED